jgi:hypothetical protein
MTVFIVPPRNVSLKVSDQLFGRGEGVLAFLSGKVTVIALTCLVVEPQNALAGHYIGEPVLEGMARTRERLLYSPKDQLSEGSFRVDNPLPEQLHGFHVGDYANAWRCCQRLQQVPLMGLNV